MASCAFFYVCIRYKMSNLLIPLFHLPCMYNGIAYKMGGEAMEIDGRRYDSKPEAKGIRHY